MPRTVPLSALPDLVGQTLQPSAWLKVTQERIDQFADATEDHQFIHVDPEQAAQTPFGSTIAHGFLTLGLVTHLISEQTIVPEGAVMGINYGSDKVRYLVPVTVESRIRANQTVQNVREKSPGQWLIKIRIVVEIENQENPAMIADILVMYFTGDSA